MLQPGVSLFDSFINHKSNSNKYIGLSLDLSRKLLLNMLRRKHMELESYYCALCNELTEETSHHLFVDCAFARMCWDIIAIQITADFHFPELTAMMRT
jgi:hypothetical protein